MTRRTRSLLVTAALFAVLFVAGAAGGYVYRYHPTHNTLDVRVTTEGSTADARTIAGTVSSLEGTRLTLSTAGGPQTITLPPGVTIEQLTRASGIPAGTRVNVGVLPTQYGLVLTGIVAVAATP